MASQLTPSSHQNYSSTAEPPKSTLISSVPRRSPLGALLSRTLPEYGGEHLVGVCDVELPVPAQSFGTFKHKSMPSLEAGLKIDTVLFSLFYPCDKPDGGRADRVVWFPKLRQTIDGFLRMAKRTPNWIYRVVSYPVAAAAIYGTTFPAYKNAAIKVPLTNQRWPLIIFSHGVGCSRLMNSAFAGEMASRGYVVAAIEHRDGTGPSTTIVTENGQKKNLDWLQWTDLEWPDLHEQPSDDTTLRHDQIKVRLAECDHVIQSMRKIVAREPILCTSVHSPDFDWKRWSCVNAERPIMAGYSFGGTVAIAAAADNRFAFERVVVFDPAMQRLDPWDSFIPSDLLVINSEEFAMSSDFQRVIEAARNSKSAHVYTIAGTTHPSFSDVFLILPEYINRKTGLKVHAGEVIHVSVRLVAGFLAQNVEVAGEVEGVRKAVELPKKPVGKPGEIIWHII